MLAFVSPETSQFLASVDVFETRRISFNLLDHSDEAFLPMLVDVFYTHVSGLLPNLSQSHTSTPFRK